MAASLDAQIKKYFNEVIKFSLSVIGEKDITVKDHCERVAGVALHFCKHLKMSSGDAQKIYLAALLHDLGMIYVPTEIIQKPEKLNEGEMAMIKMHPVLTEKVLANLSFLSEILPIVKHNHERIDGAGYPDGLKGVKIPYGARVLGIVDAYDAMIVGHPYRQPLTLEATLEEIKKMSGTQFDENLVKEFLDFMSDFASSEGAARQSTGKQSTGKKTKNTIQNMIAQIVLRFKEGKIELPVLPKIVMEIQKIIRNPIATNDDMAKIIEKDAVISLRLINISNSAMYRGVDKVQTVRQAVPRLGIRQTQSVVSTIASKSLYTATNEQLKSMMEKLWQHSLASAQASKKIGEKLGHGDVEKLYLMGLVHDIGKALLIRGMDLLISGTEEVNMQDVLAGIQDYHASFGSAILQKWGFGEEFVKMANMHNDEKFIATTKKEILIVSLASMLTRKIGCSFSSDESINLAESESAKLLTIDAEALDAICEETKKLMQESSHIF
ncbi:MAG: HDOD domain-containing protein [Pseudomonadota bacterium]